MSVNRNVTVPAGSSLGTLRVSPTSPLQTAGGAAVSVQVTDSDEELELDARALAEVQLGSGRPLALRRRRRACLPQPRRAKSRLTSEREGGELEGETRAAGGSPLDRAQRSPHRERAACAALSPCSFS